MEERLQKGKKYAVLCCQENAKLELQEAVAAVLHRNVGHFPGIPMGDWYEVVSRRCGISSRSLKRFLEKGDGVGRAAKILYAFGYRIADISVEKLPRKSSGG